MRKFLLFSLLALMGCTSHQALEKTIDNENCANITSVLVLRVMDNYVLGWVDDEVPYSAVKKYEPTDEHFIFFLKEPNKVYYPKQRIQFDTPQCLVYNGSYNYQKGATVDQTILIGKLEPNKKPNPEFLEMQKAKRLEEVDQMQTRQFQSLQEKEKLLKQEEKHFLSSIDDKKAELAQREKEIIQKEAELNNREVYLNTSSWIERRARQKAMRMIQEG